VELTDELRQEGMARELINRLQNLRKDTGLEITDHIKVVIAPSEHTDSAINAFADYIKSQVLADELTIAENDGTEIDFDDFKLNIKITKV
jgi:isoleucyl-tRNA synthetase